MDTRRTFLKKAGLAGVGTILSTAGMSAKSYARIVGANDRVNIGIVGYSDRGRGSLYPSVMHHAKELNFDIIGVSDIWKLRREEGKAGLAKLTDHDMRSYMNNDELYADKDIDAVIISTADFQHAYHTIEAARAGKDIYVEKPFAETMEDNRLARKAVEDAGVIFQVGSQRRSGWNYQAAHNFIKDGLFGPIVMCEMTWNVNQPGRWRRPDLVKKVLEQDLDWKRYLCNRPAQDFDPRKYLEYRLFWPFSSGIPGQWMAHQIDTVHWFTGLTHPRSVVANGGIYQWKDGRTNFDTITAVMEYGPLDKPEEGFQVVYSSRFSNSSGGIKEIYFSNGGELNLANNQVSPNGGLSEGEAKAMGLPANLLEKKALSKEDVQVVTAANTGADPMTSLHMRNWMESIRSRKPTVAPIDVAYNQSVACIMVNAALRTREFTQFDPEKQEVLAGGKPFLI